MLATAIGYSLIFIYSNWVAEIDLGPYFLWIALVSTALAFEGWRATALPQLAPAGGISPPHEKPTHDWPGLGKRWRDHVDAHRWWCKPELSLSDVARRLGVNATYLSRGINDGLGVNFNELINGMRAEEVARRLRAGDGTDLLTMAFDAGFNSKATFNRAFQALIGLSPSAYRRRLKIGISKVA